MAALALELFADDACSRHRADEATPQIMAMSPIHTIAHLPACTTGG
jgi:hypothetical protein